MYRNSWSKVAMCVIVAVLAFSWAQPTKAFYLEMPQALKDLFALIKVNSTKAQDSSEAIRPAYPSPEIQPAPKEGTTTAPPRDTIYCEVLRRQTSKEECGVASSQQPGGNIIFCDSLGKRITKDECDAYNSRQQSQQNQDNRMMPPNQDDQKRMGYESQPQNGDNSGEQNDQRREGMGDRKQGQNGGDMGLSNMKRGLKQMDNNLKKFEKMVTDLEKKGGQIPQELKDKIARAKSISEALNSATTAEEMQSAGMDEYPSMLQDLEESRREIFENAQRLQDVKRNIKGMEQGLKMFESQLKKLQKQKITLPADLTEKVTKARAVIDAIKNAKTWEEVESAGIEDLQDTFQDLDEGRQQLEMLARWPQTLKQIDKELSNLNKELKRDKTIVDKLAKKGIDLSSNYSLFAEVIAKLKAVRDDAVAKMSAGQSQEAFDAIENDFFGQMDDVWENSRIIQTMNNLGRFNQDFKRGITDMSRTVAKLKKNRIDIAELAELVSQIKAKGEGVLALLKEKPVDQEAISTELQDLEGLRMDFENKVQELAGEGEDMPWEIGPQQFKSIQVAPALNQYTNRKPEVVEREDRPVTTEPSISLAPLPSP